MNHEFSYLDISVIAIHSPKTLLRDYKSEYNNKNIKINCLWLYLKSQIYTSTDLLFKN